ncbi:hypothetical protein J4462_00540 [Candidatus Pacearchaeota archaeon]|nr:hypothetical protein [Candidatus Pacearchaeota archaeon]
MAIKVSTGGTKTFHYPKGHEPKINEKEKQEIEHAYEKYYERRASEKKRRIILIVVIVLIVIALALFLFFSRL